MKTITIHRSIVVGLFITVGLALFLAAVFTIGTQEKLFQKTAEIKTIFGDIRGLQKGNNVWLSGVKVGTVKKINFHGNAEVEVTMSIEKLAEGLVRKNSKTKISSDGLIGNKIVIIYGGSPESPVVSDEDYLQSESSATTDEMFATLQKNNQNLLTITDDLKAITKKINTGDGTIGKLINDPGIANEARGALIHFKITALNTEKAVKQVDAFVSNLNKQGTLANDLVTDTIVFANLKNIMGHLKAAAHTIDNFALNIDHASSSLNNTNNTAGFLLNDEQAAADIKSILGNLKKSSAKLDEDLTAIQHNFLLRGYFKKQAKQKDSTEHR